MAHQQKLVITQLKERINQPLPGLEAQLKLASTLRTGLPSIRSDHKNGGVLLFLYPKNQEWHMVFMKRPQNGRTHSGQISFPGGKMEATDPDICYTALRESDEELGIRPAEVEVLGALTQLYIPNSNYLVYPCLGVSYRYTRFAPNPSEVSEVIEAPLSLLLDPQTQTYAEVHVSSGFHMEVPAFKVDSHIIWGATAMILNEFLTLVREIS